MEKVRSFPVHAMKVQLHLFLNSALDGHEGLAPLILNSALDGHERSIHAWTLMQKKARQTATD